MAEARPTRIPIERRVTQAQRDADGLAERIAQVSQGGARAAVLGVSDGLVTNVSLILGVAGANASASSVRIAGLASLVAGAFSMAAGEWVSVRSQVHLYSAALDEIRRLVARNPRLILHELAARLESAGLGRTTAQLASTELPLDEPRFMRFTARTVFGLDPDQLGSPLVAAGTSFALFALGALIPLLPWLWSSGTAASLLSIALTMVASVSVGGYVGRTSGRGAARGALVQVTVVACAAGVTFGIGKGFGAVTT